MHAAVFVWTMSIKIQNNFSEIDELAVFIKLRSFWEWVSQEYKACSVWIFQHYSILTSCFCIVISWCLYVGFLRVISNEVLKLLWMVICCLNFQIHNPFGVRLFQIAMSITVFILLKISKVYSTNAVASVYVFESSFQSYLEVFRIIKHTIATARRILQKYKSDGWGIIW